MVAIVHQSNSLRNAIQYNEHKVKQKVAEIIHSGNYPKDTELLSFTERFNRLKMQTELSTTIKVNTVHISLNFAEEDKGKLNTERLKEIADTYMRKIGFGEQPYLVYKHTDAGHEHLHIVTTNVRNNGTGISLHNLAKDRSLKAAQAIEKEFGLTVATDKHRLAYQLKPINTLKIQYGRAETKRAITNVLDHVLAKYKYTSVHELNAVLKLYNVMADTGGKDTRIAKNGGLVYRVINEKGEKIGIPVKASIIYNKPTLKFLQEKFSENETLRQRYKRNIKNRIDYTLKTQRGKITVTGFAELLKQEGIHLAVRQNEAGRIYGLTYIDHKNKVVFNGSDLGPNYAAAGLMQRLESEQNINREQKNVLQQKETVSERGNRNVQKQDEFSHSPTINPIKETAQNVLDILTKEEYSGTLSIELQNELKRRRRKKLRPQ